MIKVEIPKEGIRLYAMMKAHELKHDIELKTDEQAINYLKSIGIEIINNKDEIIAALKAENERLKAELKNNKATYEVELGTYNMECGNLLEENKQLLQTLQELKEIAKRELSLTDKDDELYDVFSEILQKIIKAEEE